MFETMLREARPAGAVRRVWRHLAPPAERLVAGGSPSAAGELMIRPKPPPGGITGNPDFMNASFLQPRLRLSILMLATMLATSLMATAAQAANAGITRLAIPYLSTRIDTVIWYPSDAPEQAVGAGPFQPIAAPDGPFSAKIGLPLVLLSHGTGGMNLNHHPIATALARAGYIVAAPTHPGDNFRDRSLMADERYFVERPRQASAVIDALLTSPVWGPRIDAARIGALGHSAGGYTVAALAGARPDRDRLVAHCQAGTGDPACRYGDPSVGVQSTDGGAAFELPAGERDHEPVRDDRVRAVLMFAPLGAVIAPDSLRDRSVRIAMVGAEHDEVLGRQWHHDWLAAQLPQGASRLAPGAGHFAFIAPAQLQWRAQLGEVAIDPPGFDRGVFQQTLSVETVRFFDDALPGGKD